MHDKYVSCFHCHRGDNYEAALMVEGLRGRGVSASHSIDRIGGSVPLPKTALSSVSDASCGEFNVRVRVKTIDFFTTRS
jgi:hypothetical protein